jgi:hypothetical protein
MGMDMIALIVGISACIWYVIDRVKPLWSDYSFGKYITTAVAAIASFLAVFAYDIDLIYAIGLAESSQIAGQIITAFIFMSGSSAISEIITRIKGEN